MIVHNETSPNTHSEARRRLQWVDAIRALAIVLVIFGHQAKGMTPFFVFTSPVKIPLFFMISGFVFNEKRSQVTDLLVKLARTIVVPWLALTLPFALLKYIRNPEFDIMSYVFELISGKRLWYITCCIVAEIIWFYSLKITKGKYRTARLFAVSLVVFVAGLIMSRYDVMSFAMMNRACVAQFFLFMGYVFRRYKKQFESIPSVVILTSFVIYILIGIISLVYWPGCIMDIHNNIYYNLPICYVMIVLGCYILFIVASKKDEYPSAIRFIGQNTLVFYLMHGTNLALIHKIASILGLAITLPLARAIIDTSLACLSCGIEAMIINRCFPFLIGKKSEKAIVS